MNDKLDECREEVAYFMRRLYEQGLTTTSGGNLSVRFSDDEILVTPSASDKGRMKGSEIGIMSPCGKILSKFKPSIESSMHLKIYEARPDVKAIVHAHPVVASTFAATDARINCRLLAESYAILGRPAYAPYRLMGTGKLAEIVAEAAKSANCIIMENHGALTVGKSLLEAFDRLEVLETCAKMTLISEGFLKKNIRLLGDGELLDIDRLMGRA
ncbi:MAG: class II aldolase/adducin family protein [Victivallales bacterium]|jgi:L-fuculose-phosphate aldolase